MAQYYSFNEIIRKMKSRFVQLKKCVRVEEEFRLNLLFVLSYVFDRKAYHNQLRSVLTEILYEYDRQYSCNIENREVPKDEYKIWVMWWQGMHGMPQTIKACYQQLLLCSGKYEIVLITQENVQNYIEIPARVINKFHKGIMTQTDLSDYIRVSLLNQYGGLWVDSSIFCLKEIKEIDQYSFYTGKSIGQRKWTTYLMAVNETGTELFARLEYYIRRYWEEYDVQFNYFFLDMLIEYLYENNRKIHDQMDSVPENNKDIFKLLGILSEPYDERVYKKLKDDNTFQKLSQKKDFKLYKKKRPTYGNVLLRK